MPKNKQKDTDFNQNKDVQEILNSIYSMEYGEEASSSKGSKRQKIVDVEPRRKEVDTNKEVEAEDGIEVPPADTKDFGMQVNFMAIEVNEFETFQKQQKTDLNSLRRSVVYSINQLDKKLEHYFAQKGSHSEINEYISNLNLDEPIKEIENFLHFDDRIKNDNEFVKIFRDFLSYKTQTHHLHEAISGVLNIVMAVELQQQYSGCGKPKNGISKFNFSSTQTYKELRDALRQKFKTETDASILTKTSRWLAQAKDRNGGRSSR